MTFPVWLPAAGANGTRPAQRPPPELTAALAALDQITADHITSARVPTAA